MKAEAHLAEQTHRAYERLPRTLRARSTGAPRPGDLRIVEETAGFGVEWAILARGPSGADRLLAVPADAQPLVGCADVAVSASASVGPVVLRCRFGGWFPSGVFANAVISGTLDPAHVSQAREKVAAAEGGTLVASILEEEVEDDPEYQSWVRGALEPARQALMDPTPIGKPESNSSWPSQSSRFQAWLLPLAALFILALGLGLLRQHQQIRDFRNGVLLNPLSVPLDWPTQNHRGKEKKVPVTAEVSYVMFYLPLKDSLAGQSYHAELAESSGRRLWSGSGLENVEGEISIGFHVSRLPEGKYSLRIYRQTDSRELMAEFPLRIVRSDAEP